MAHDFKKNQTVRYLGAEGINSIGTCYEKGDLVQIYSLVGDDTVYIIDEKKDIRQTCYIHQIEAIETTPKLPEKDSYICLLHDDTEVGTTLIRVSQVDIMGDKMHISGNFILFNPNRFYFDTTGQYPLNIKFRLCTQREKNWLDWCIGKNTFVEQEDIPSKGNSLLIRPDHKTTITANFHSISDNCVNVDNIRIRGEVSQVLPSAQKTYKIRDCIRISESKLEEIHHSEPKMKVEKPTINVNGGYNIGDYLEITYSKSVKYGKIISFAMKQDPDNIYAYVTHITPEGNFHSNEFIGIKGKGTTSKLLTSPERIRWLEYCIAEKRFVHYSSIPKPEPTLNPSLALPSLPDEGWCKDGDTELGKLFATKFDLPYISPGTAGYAWNKNSYWKIDIASGKPTY